MHGGVLAVFIAIVGARLLVPLAIPKWPLPGILASFTLDAVDHSVFQAFGYDPPEYQGYDKALDTYYLALAYLSTLRNWSARPAFEVGRFLYFYRLVGVVAFEFANARALLLVFANTFEYFFIAYEVLRTRWNPSRASWRGWTVTAAAIWVVIKLPQEWWIHVAKLDFTDTFSEHAWFAALVIVGVGVLAALGWLVVLPRLPSPDHPFSIRVDPLPAEVATAADAAAWNATHGGLRSWATAEKIVLVGLLAVLFEQVMPDLDASPRATFVGVAVFVVINAMLALVLHRRAPSIESLALGVLLRAVVNMALVIVDGLLLDQLGGHLGYGHAVFFALLISLLLALHDRWEPVHSWRIRNS